MLVEIDCGDGAESCGNGKISLTNVCWRYLVGVYVGLLYLGRC